MDVKMHDGGIIAEAKCGDGKCVSVVDSILKFCKDSKCTEYKDEPYTPLYL